MGSRRRLGVAGGMSMLGLVLVVRTATDDSIAANAMATKFGVVIDAGSSGSRVYLYKWDCHVAARGAHTAATAGPANLAPLLGPGGDPLSMKIEPGLSSFVASPTDALNSLKPLLRFAMQHVPSDHHRDTHLFVLATAGLRMLPPATRSAMLRELRNELPWITPFTVKPADVRMLTGDQEGLYIWITMNYVLRQKGLLAAAETVGCLDMGGGSAQIAYEVDPAAPLSPTVAGSIHKFGFWHGEPERTVFVTSLIGFGANEGRRRYVQHLEAGTGHGDVALDPCMPLGQDEAWKPGEISKGSLGLTLVGTGRFADCFEAVKPMMRSSERCSKAPCSFADLDLPKPRGEISQWYGLSEYWYTSEDVFGIGGRYNPGRFRAVAASFCGTNWSTLVRNFEAGQYPLARMSRLRLQCFKAAWMSAMLHEGYRFPAEQTFNTAAHVQGFDVQTWTLGAMLDMAQSIRCIRDDGDGGGGAGGRVEGLRGGGEGRGGGWVAGAVWDEVAVAASFFGLGAGLGLLWYSTFTSRKKRSAVASMA